ncbi:hypothetical protein EBT31_14640 [bacterium]|jgi:hypothetical protein|nr:hypothetical protein [bacterium]
MAIEFEKIITYDPATGKACWAVTRGPRAKVGEEIGSVTRDGYLRVKIEKRMYFVHRLIWRLSYGDWPTHEIDHLDGNRLNNKLSNLRDVPKTLNLRNSRRRIDNISGTTGVHEVYNPTKYWVAQWRDGKRKNKWFSVPKYGDEKAKQLAIEYRAARIKELGAYTERHGS